MSLQQNVLTVDHKKSLLAIDIVSRSVSSPHHIIICPVGVTYVAHLSSSMSGPNVAEGAVGRTI